ncbi:MAG: peptidoglycan DD-metalloendopeptidase family protein [Candidatus Puniceispirillaceae bacterium]
MIKQFALSVTALLLLSACEGRSLSLPEIDLPDLSLTRKTPAPVEIGGKRVERAPIPVSRTIIAEQGDTIYSLATRYQVTPQSLIADNDLVAPFAISAGQSLAITPPREHVVSASDNLYLISQRYAVSQFHLAELNELQEPYQLVQGQKLLIPDTHDFSVLDGSKGVDTALARPAAKPVTTIAQANSRQVDIPKANQPRKNFVAPSFASGESFTWPLEGEIIQDFGPAGKGIHNDGVNIGANAGAAVQASAPGTVAYIGRNLKSFGSMILIKHDGGYITAYAHLDEIRVAEGDVLGAGQIVGTVGQTGRVTRPQLHFEVRQSRRPINPHDIIKS